MRRDRALTLTSPVNKAPVQEAPYSGEESDEEEGLLAHFSPSSPRAPGAPMQSSSKAAAGRSQRLEARMEPEPTLIQQPPVYDPWYRAARVVLPEPLTLKRAVKASVAYLVAAVFTLSPNLRAVYGPTSYLCATGMTWYQPGRSVGGMIQAYLLGVIFLVLSAGFSVAVLALMVTTHTLSYALVCAFAISGAFVGSLVLAYYRGATSNPAFMSATTLSFILIFSSITKEDTDALHDLKLGRMISICSAFMTGSTISFLVNILLWPETASAKLEREVDASLYSLKELVKLITKTFLLDADARLNEPTRAGPNSQLGIVNREKLKQELAGHRKTHVGMGMSRMDARFEFFHRAFYKLAEFDAVMVAVSRLTQHVSAMSSSVFLQNSLLTAEQAEVLLDFIQLVGPSLRQVAFDCKELLKEMRSALSTSDYDREAEVLSSLSETLSKSVQQFSVDQKAALTKLFSNAKLEGKRKEHIFLVYFFAFSLVELSRELQGGMLSSVMSLMQPKRKSWKNVSELFRSLFSSTSSRMVAAEDKILPKPNFITGLASLPKSNSRTMLFGTENATIKFSAGLHEPVAHTLVQRVNERIWVFLESLRSASLVFAFKTALSITVLVAAAFILPAFREFYDTYRLDWALVSIFVVVTPTVGGTNANGVARILGTVFGCLCGYLSYLCTRSFEPLSYLCVLLFAVPTFHLLLHTRYTRIARVAILAYCVVFLGKINLDEHDPENEIPMIEFVLKRTFAVLSGIIVGLLVTWYLWPFEARVHLRTGISNLLQNLGYLYTLVVNDMETDHLEGDSTENSLDALDARPDTAVRARRAFIDLEMQIQGELLSLGQLVPLTRSEPRLKGPFPTEAYLHLLNSAQVVLDCFLSMRVASRSYKERHLKRKNVEEREELYGSVQLFFWTLSCALKLKEPLPPYLPPLSAARRRWTDQIEVAAERGEGYTLYSYAYSVAMGSVISEMELLGRTVKALFGEMQREVALPSRERLLSV